MQEFENERLEAANQESQESTQTEKDRVARVNDVSKTEDGTFVEKQLSSNESCCTADTDDELRGESVSHVFPSASEVEIVMDDKPERVSSHIVHKPDCTQENGSNSKNNFDISLTGTTSKDINEESQEDLDLGLCLSKPSSSESLGDHNESGKDVASTQDNMNSTCIVSIDLADQQDEDHSVTTLGDPLEQFDNEPACRICHCGNEAGPLISPCLCTGSVKHIHHSCLMDWLKRCVNTKCELCLYPITVHRKTKPLKKWRRPGQKPTPIIWLLTFIVALTLNIASIAKDGSQKCVSNPCIIFYVVGALGALLGFAFFYHWLRVSIRYIKQWMALNEEWTLVKSDKESTLGNANLALSDKSLGSKEQQDGATSVVEVV